MEEMDIISEPQKISLMVYKLRINGYPNARCIGKNNLGKYLFTGLTSNPLINATKDFDEVLSILNGMSTENTSDTSKNTYSWL